MVNGHWSMEGSPDECSLMENNSQKNLWVYVKGSSMRVKKRGTINIKTVICAHYGVGGCLRKKIIVSRWRTSIMHRRTVGL